MANSTRQEEKGGREKKKALNLTSDAIVVDRG